MNSAGKPKESPLVATSLVSSENQEGDKNQKEECPKVPKKRRKLFSVDMI